MADIKISELPVATVVNDADVLVINQGTTTKQATRTLVNGNTVVSLSGGGTGLLPNTATSGAVTLSGTLLPASGGTGVTASTGANSVVLRDASQNITTNSVIEGFTSVVASGTQIVLTVASTPVYFVTGSGGQAIKLPNATTLQNGVVYHFNNNQSSGTISVTNNSDVVVASIPFGGLAQVMLTSNATTAGSWERHEQAPSNVTWGTNTLAYPGTITQATWNGDTVAVNRGGTGQSTFTDGQLLIGNTTGNTLAKSTLTAGSNVTITNGPGTITIASTAGTVTPTNVQVFTSSGTWTKPAGAVSVNIQLLAGGGGGGAGRKDSTAGTVRCGGGGGGGGSIVNVTVPASLLGATETVTIGAGGGGGPAQATDVTNGTGGSSGTATSFGLNITANGGTGGGGGTATTGTGGSGVLQGNSGSSASATGGGGSTGVPSAITSAAQPGGASGASGGGLGTSNTPVAGAAGGRGLIANLAGGLAGAAGANASNGNANTLASTGLFATGSAGGSGGSSITANGGNGGAGGFPAAAGGGGAACGFATGSSGAGGAGAAGMAIITTYF